MRRRPVRQFPQARLSLLQTSRFESAPHKPAEDAPRMKPLAELLSKRAFI
jgi:hypothetical protein